MKTPESTPPTSDGIDRRGFLECMAWAGTGVLWSISGGILSSTVLGSAEAAAATGGDFTFIQISDSHIGFNKPANTDVAGTCREAIARINALPKQPDFLLHTGDLTHLSETGEFDTMAELLKECRTKDVFCVPGEHDIMNDNGAQYRERFGKNSKGAGWYSFDSKGVHFIGLVNVANIKEGGLGILGAEQLAWLEKDVVRPLGQHADRGLRAHPAVGGLSGVGLGHRRRRRRRLDS